MPGTDFVVWLTSIFSVWLGADYLGTFLAFNIAGSVGLLAFFASLKQATVSKKNWVRQLVLLVVLLPSVSFWTSAIGKDSIAFMSAGMVLWASIDLARRTGLMLFAILLMFAVRPHIAAVMVVSLIGTYVLDERHSMLRRVLLCVVGFVGAALLVPFTVGYVGLESAGPESVSAYIDRRQTYNQSGGGGVDISSMSLPMQLFTYLLRPMPTEAQSVFQFASSLDNCVLLLVFSLGIFGLLKLRVPDVSASRLFLWIYSLTCWCVLAMTTANLGIAVRQKWMFMPMLIFLLVSLVGKRRGALGSKAIDFMHPVAARSE